MEKRLICIPTVVLASILVFGGCEQEEVSCLRFTDEDPGKLTGYRSPKLGEPCPKDVIIPEGTTSIGLRAFFRKSLDSVTFAHDGLLHTIGISAFRSNNLTSVDIPEGVEKINSEAFAFNPLSSLTLPESLTYIGFDAFKGTQLTSVIIPMNVMLIYSRAFGDNPNLASVCIEAPEENIEIAPDAFPEAAVVEFAEDCSALL